MSAIFLFPHAILHILTSEVNCRDWLVCLGREWRVIWKGEWSLVKVLYIFTRYWSLPTMAVSLWAFTDMFEFSYCHKFVHVVVRLPLPYTFVNCVTS